MTPSGYKIRVGFFEGTTAESLRDKVIGFGGLEIHSDNPAFLGIGQAAIASSLNVPDTLFEPPFGAAGRTAADHDGMRFARLIPPEPEQ